MCIRDRNHRVERPQGRWVMANKTGHRRFGNIRKLPSRRYQVRYRGPDGAMRSAPLTFARKEEAQRWLTLTEARMARDEWIAPERAKIQRCASSFLANVS